VETIWPLSVVACRNDSALGGKGVLPLRTFIQETLRRSRTSYSTLQVALYYLIMIKAFVPKHDFTMEQPHDGQSSRAMQCGRRMFLAALILASKYLQDRNYSARAWSKISGLNTFEINQNELAFLAAVDWKLHIPEPIFQRWTDIVLKYTPSAQAPTPLGMERVNLWKAVIPILTPELDTIDIEQSSPKRCTPDLYEMGIPSPAPSTGDGRIGYASNDQTPTNNIPLTLEPSTRAEPPPSTLPPLPRLGPLPTPQMTPQSSGLSTPAVSAGGYQRKGSICSVMAQIQNSCIARTAMDRCPLASANNVTTREYFPTSARRSSLAQSTTSSASSPESMVSDVSTRSSRSSSISSVTSSNCAPGSQPRLAVQATRRCANLQQLPGPIKESRRNVNVMATPTEEKFYPADYFSSPESYSGPIGAMNVPDLSNITLSTPRSTSPLANLHPSAKEAAQSLCDLSQQTPPQHTLLDVTASQRRKRSRPSSSDLSQTLQQNVRELMALNTLVNEDDSTVLPDSMHADSFVLGRRNTEVFRGSSAMKVMGSRKRACCSEEVSKLARDQMAMPGPGMWDGILR
jgi:PHO85 cyclin-5